MSQPYPRSAISMRKNVPENNPAFFCENCQVTKEMFKRFIKEEKLAYDINKDELKNAFMSL